MVSITEMTVYESRKINLGNYESMDIFLSLKANASNENVDEVHEVLKKKIKEKLDKQEEEIKKNLRVTNDQTR